MFKTYPLLFLILSFNLGLFMPILEASDDWLPDTNNRIEQLADAIYHSEGGLNAKKPYGILSVQCDTESDCRRICKNTIRNNYKRWLESDTTKDYLVFLRDRYAPIGSSNDSEGLNNHWLSNVQWFLCNSKAVE
jgi:hypothetical protein